MDKRIKFMGYELGGYPVVDLSAFLKKNNGAGCGGASDGLDYTPLLKEITFKMIVFGILSACSFFGLVLSMYSNGYSYSQMWELFLMIPYDVFMRWGDDILYKKGSRIGRFFKGLIMFPVIRYGWYRAVKKMLNKYISWETMEKRKLVSLASYCVCAADELAINFGLKNNFSLIDLVTVLKGGKYKDSNRRKISPYYFTNVGIFKADLNHNKIVMVSETVVSQPNATLATFNNPALPKMWVKYVDIRDDKVIKRRWIDGGLVNNQANLLFLGMPKKTWRQFLCNKEPLKSKELKKKTYNEINYNQNRPLEGRVHEFIGKQKDNWFLAMYDEAINAHFKDVIPSNIYRS